MKLSLPVAIAVCALAASGQEPTRSFPAEVELVALDIAVVDDEGKPVGGLRPSEFRLEVGGRARQVVSAEYLPVEGGEEEPATLAAQLPFSTNETTAPRRVVLLVVDSSNIGMAEGRDVLAATASLFDGLSRRDHVGLLTIPASGPREEFTTDHLRVREALGKVTGRGQLRARSASANSFTVAEALACGDETSEVGMDAERCNAALNREAGTDPSRRRELREEMWAFAHEYRSSSSASRSVLRDLLRTLRNVPGQKVIVLVSQGLLFSEMGAGGGGGGHELQELVSAATAAKVSFYVVPVNERGTMMTAAGSIPQDALEDDRRLRFRGLESLAVGVRGAVLRGIPERAFARALSETSAYYRLGFEPEAEDREGKERKVKVSLTRPGLTVRGRQVVTFPSAKIERERKDAIVTLLESPTLATDLPLRATAWILPDPAEGKVKVLVGAEIGGGAEAQGLQIGSVLLDGQGKAAASSTQAMKPDAALPTGQPIPFGTTMSVAPGSYTLRLAVRDGRGRLGSVEHAVRADLGPSGPLQASDLLVGPPPQSGRAFRPAVTATPSGGPLLTHCELRTDLPFDTLTATLEIAATGSESTLLSLPARIVATSTPGRVLAQAAVNTDALEPGRYVARLVISSSGQRIAMVHRSFGIAAP